MQIQLKVFLDFFCPSTQGIVLTTWTDQKEQISDRKRRISVSHRNHWNNGWNNSIPSLSMDKLYLALTLGLPRKILQPKV